MDTIKVTHVKPLSGFIVELGFSDGSQRETDLEPYLHGEVFELIRNNAELFLTVQVKPEERTISWANGVDIDPYTLYYGLLPEWGKEDDELTDLLAARRASRERIVSTSVIPATAIDQESGIR